MLLGTWRGGRGREVKREIAGNVDKQYPDIVCEKVMQIYLKNALAGAKIPRFVRQD